MTVVWNQQSDLMDIQYPQENTHQSVWNQYYQNNN
jgi:hypothetical protein